jgi:hypothetical protein
MNRVVSGLMKYISIKAGLPWQGAGDTVQARAMGTRDY